MEKKKSGRPKKDTAPHTIRMTDAHYKKAIEIGGRLTDGVALMIEAYKVKGDKK